MAQQEFRHRQSEFFCFVSPDNRWHSCHVFDHAWLLSWCFWRTTRMALGSFLNSKCDARAMVVQVRLVLLLSRLQSVHFLPISSVPGLVVAHQHLRNLHSAERTKKKKKKTYIWTKLKNLEKTDFGFCLLDFNMDLVACSIATEQFTPRIPTNARTFMLKGTACRNPEIRVRNQTGGSPGQDFTPGISVDGAGFPMPASSRRPCL